MEGERTDLEPPGRTSWNWRRWIEVYRTQELGLLITAVIIGVGTGFAAIIFRELISTVGNLGFGGGREIFRFLGPYYVILIPALGGLIVGPLLYFFAPEAKGHGVPEVMYAVALKGGRIRPVVALIKALASSVCIGTGGSVGREGPIVQIGSTLGSSVGQMLGMSRNGVRMLVACGAAGGISATFNAPVAGVLFALEVILGEFAVGHFATVVISSVTASVIARMWVGDVLAFEVTEYSMHSPWELLLYVLLGVLAAFVGVTFSKLLYAFEDVVDAWNFPEYFKPVVGGLIIGFIGLFLPEIFGVGYEAIESVLRSEILLSMAVLLVVMKILATSITLAFGGSGGVFAPSLFIGAMLGGAFGQAANLWLPDLTAPAGAYALVGMAAVFSAAARAPISAIIILFEMTGDYRIILPLMLSTVVATLLGRALDQESIYTRKLSRRGIRLHQGRDVDVMRSVSVSEVMAREVPTIPSNLPVADLPRLFQAHQRRAFPVVAGNGDLVGIVTLADVSRAENGPGGRKKTAGEIATRSLVTTHPEATMWEALRRMAPLDLNTLPVVSRDNPQKLLGVIRRRDILRAYNLTVIQRNEIEQQIDEARLETGKIGFAEFRVSPGSTAVGRALSELKVPRRCVIVSVQRGDRILVPRGDTVLESGDKITAFLERQDHDALREILGASKVRS